METPQALELWGNMFLNAARGQRLVEDFSRTMKEDAEIFQDLGEIYGKWWGMDFFFRDAPGYFSAYLKAAGDFQKSFLDAFLSLVSCSWIFARQDDYQALLRDYEELREKNDRQEEDIRRLQAVLDEKLSLQGEGIGAFQNLMKKQTQQFQDMVVNFSKIFQEAGSSEETGKAAGSSAKKRSPDRHKT